MRSPASAKNRGAGTAVTKVRSGASRAVTPGAAASTVPQRNAPSIASNPAACEPAAQTSSATTVTWISRPVSGRRSRSRSTAYLVPPTAATASRAAAGSSQTACTRADPVVRAVTAPSSSQPRTSSNTAAERGS